MPEDSSDYSTPIETITPPTEAQEDIWFRSEMQKALGIILEDPIVEAKLNGVIWMISAKSLKLTFLTEKDIESYENYFEALICRFLRSLPPQAHVASIGILLDQGRMIFQANIRRSLGTSAPKLNERVALLSQWKIQGSPTATMSPQKKPGILQRIFG